MARWETISSFVGEEPKQDPPTGWVPVSGVSPSILFSEIEVEKKFKFSERPPILPAPHHDKGGKR